MELGHALYVTWPVLSAILAIQVALGLLIGFVLVRRRRHLFTFVTGLTIGGGVCAASRRLMLPETTENTDQEGRVMPASTSVDFRAHRIFDLGHEFRGAITPSSVVLVSLTEVDSRGNPFIGDATMKVYNVVPGNGIVRFRGEIDWDRDLNVRANIFIATP